MIEYSLKPIVLSLLTVSMLFCGAVLAQDQIRNENGIIITKKDDVTIFYDEFTGKYTIAAIDSTLISSLDKRHEEKDGFYIIPFFGGDIFGENLTELAWTERWNDDFNIILIRIEPENYFFEENGTKQIPFLIDEKRLSKSVHYLKRSSAEIIRITFTSTEWDSVIKSENSRYRISGQVYTIGQNTKNLMEQILSEHERIQGDKQKPDRSAPYYLQWDGEFHRSPMVQPLPSNLTNVEGEITIRIEVQPNGSIGRIISLRKINPELEREVMQKLRSWRFSRLPSGVPQVPQWGTITFQFVID
jgi:TonB family protein